MTVTTERPVAPWQTHPGWGIVVDLTPREVVEARQVRIHRRLIGLALLLVLALCAGVGLLTRAGTATAQRDYDREQARTTQLAAAAQDYAPIVTMQTVTTQSRADLAAVLAPDVDIVHLLARIRVALPPGLLISTETVLLTPPTADAAATDPAAPVGTAPKIIGSVNLSGTGAAIDAVTPFVSALDGMRGIVDVLPASVTQSDTGTDFTISLNITDKLYVERTPAGGR